MTGGTTGTTGGVVKETDLSDTIFVVVLDFGADFDTDTGKLILLFCWINR